MLNRQSGLVRLSLKHVQLVIKAAPFSGGPAAAYSCVAPVVTDCDVGSIFNNLHFSFFSKPASRCGQSISRPHSCRNHPRPQPTGFRLAVGSAVPRRLQGEPLELKTPVSFSANRQGRRLDARYGVGVSCSISISGKNNRSITQWS